MLKVRQKITDEMCGGLPHHGTHVTGVSWAPEGMLSTEQITMNHRITIISLILLCGWVLMTGCASYHVRAKDSGRLEDIYGIFIPMLNEQAATPLALVSPKTCVPPQPRPAAEIEARERNRAKGAPVGDNNGHVNPSDADLRGPYTSSRTNPYGDPRTEATKDLNDLYGTTNQPSPSSAPVIETIDEKDVYKEWNGTEDDYYGGGTWRDWVPSFGFGKK